MKKYKIAFLLLLITFSLVACNKDLNTPPTNQTVENKTLSTKDAEEKNIPSSSGGKNNIAETQVLFEKGYHDYQGTINQNLKIRMSIYPDDKSLIGTYFYESIKKEIMLKGKIESGKIILYEFDASGKSTGVFNGTISTVDGFEGIWSSSDGKSQFPFKVTLNDITGGSYGHRYSVAGFDDDIAIEKFVEKLQEYIKNEDKEKVALLISYPRSVKIGGKNVVINTKEEFIKNYDNIFHPEFKKTITNAFTKYMFCNYQGIMFGGNLGNMWINNVIKPDKLETLVTAINN